MGIRRFRGVRRSVSAPPRREPMILLGTYSQQGQGPTPPVGCVVLFNADTSMAGPLWPTFSITGVRQNFSFDFAKTGSPADYLAAPQNTLDFFMASIENPSFVVMESSEEQIVIIAELRSDDTRPLGFVFEDGGSAYSDLILTSGSTSHRFRLGRDTDTSYISFDDFVWRGVEADDLSLNTSIRATLYFNTLTRQVGMVVNGVNLGYLDNTGRVPEAGPLFIEPGSYYMTLNGRDQSNALTRWDSFQVSLSFAVANLQAGTPAGVSLCEYEPILPSCSISLTGEAAADFGLSPANISEQTFGISGGDGGYLASTNVFSPYTAWTGRRFLEMSGITTNGLANIRGGFVTPTGSKGVFFNVNADGSKSFRTEAPVGNIISTQAADTATDTAGLFIDFPSGDVYGTIDGVVAGGGALFSGFFSGEGAVVILGLIESAPGGSASMTFNTTSSSLTSDYSISGLQDMCGNPVNYWTPDALGFGNTFVDIANIGTAWQDVDRTVSASATNDLIAYIDNLSNTGGGGLIQPIPTDRLRRKSTREFEKTATGSSKLILNDTLDLSTGLTLALDIFTASANSQFIGGDNSHFRLYRSGTSLVLALGSGTTLATYTSAIENNSRRRIVITADTSGGAIYSEGNLLGTFTPAIVTTVFNQVVLGSASATSSSTAYSSFGRAAFLKGKVDVNQSNKILGWLLGV
jgi:hypothetical protein